MPHKLKTKVSKSSYTHISDKAGVNSKTIKRDKEGYMLISFPLLGQNPWDNLE
jgi:hypothetical protein